jgi:16S rRNA (adenine1518-N6/adenine1519-N6)-dimethyltransferase
MKPTEIKHILQELGGGANKRLGQHFLIDSAALEAIVAEAPAHPASVVLEVGPGLGVLTHELLAKGCRVIAVERDGRFIDYLTSRFATFGDQFTLVRGDAAEVDWMNIVGENEWSLVSNLPYSISSLAMRLALWSPRPAEHVVVLVQREVAERATEVAPKGKTSLLSLMVALAAESLRIVRRVPAGAFFPPPKVESAVLEIVPMPWTAREKTWGIDPEHIMRIAKAGFAHPRKKMMGNLVTGNIATKDQLERVFASLNFDTNVRAEDLSPEEWAKLARATQEG